VTSNNNLKQKHWQDLLLATRTTFSLFRLHQWASTVIFHISVLSSLLSLNFMYFFFLFCLAFSFYLFLVCTNNTLTQISVLHKNFNWFEIFLLDLKLSEVVTKIIWPWWLKIVSLCCKTIKAFIRKFYAAGIIQFLNLSNISQINF
jgi:hypothetical protein